MSVTVSTRTVAVNFFTILMAAGVAFAADSGTAGKTAIKPAPAFTPAQLTALPTTAWITNGGSVFNQRFSPLKQLDRTSVKELKAVWRASLGGSGLGIYDWSPLDGALFWSPQFYRIIGADPARRVDHARAFGRCEFGADRLDDAVADEDVAACERPRGPGRDDARIVDEHDLRNRRSVRKERCNRGGGDCLYTVHCPAPPVKPFAC